MELGNSCLELAISRGSILHSEKFNFIDHGKLFIVLGKNDEEIVGCFFINSKIANCVARVPQFYAMQMGIKRSDYPDILSYDSFVDCHEIMPIPKKDLLNQLKTGDVQIKGCLNEQDINLLLDVVRNSDLFTENEKATFFK